MAHQSSSSSSTLYPNLESQVAPLDENSKYTQIIEIENKLVSLLKEQFSKGDPLDKISDKTLLPNELLTDTSKVTKAKVNPLNRLKDLTNEEVEDEEETADEEDEDEEIAEDEEDDAGGDYLVSHFDNGEGYEDNDDEGEETGMIT